MEGQYNLWERGDIAPTTSPLPTEQWKWIEGYEGLYQISTEGRLKSFHKHKEGYILSNVNTKGWYLTVVLKDDFQRIKTERIHRLVAKTFIGDIPRGYHVHHKDGNKQNNCVENLEIISPKKHNLETRKMKPYYCEGMNNYNQNIKPKHVRQYTLEGQFIAEYVNAKIASDLTGVCGRNILQVCNNKNEKKKRSQAGGYVWKFAE